MLRAAPGRRNARSGHESAGHLRRMPETLYSRHVRSGTLHHPRTGARLWHCRGGAVWSGSAGLLRRRWARWARCTFARHRPEQAQRATSGERRTGRSGSRTIVSASGPGRCSPGARIERGAARRRSSSAPDPPAGLRGPRRHGGQAARCSRFLRSRRLEQGHLLWAGERRITRTGAFRIEVSGRGARRREPAPGERSASATSGKTRCRTTADWAYGANPDEQLDAR